MDGFQVQHRIWELASLLGLQMETLKPREFSWLLWREALFSGTNLLTLNPLYDTTTERSQLSWCLLTKLSGLCEVYIHSVTGYIWNWILGCRPKFRKLIFSNVPYIISNVHLQTSWRCGIWNPFFFLKLHLEIKLEIKFSVRIYLSTIFCILFLLIKLRTGVLALRRKRYCCKLLGNLAINMNGKSLRKMLSGLLLNYPCKAEFSLGTEGRKGKCQSLIFKRPTISSKRQAKHRWGL